MCSSLSATVHFSLIPRNIILRVNTLTMININAISTSSQADMDNVVHQCVMLMRTLELQEVLETIQSNNADSITVLRDRVFNLLSSPQHTQVLREKILSIFKLCENSDTLQPHLELPPNILSPLQNQSHNIHAEFESLPFFQTKQTLLKPMHCETIQNKSSFSGLFHLSDETINSVKKSWSIFKQEYKIQIILRLVQIDLQDNATKRLPYNITVSVNGNTCKLPNLNFPTKVGVIPWRYNVPIDISRQSDLRNNKKNTLTVNWSGEPLNYFAALYVAEKLTWSELLVDVKKRPMRSSANTKLLITKSLESDGDMGIDSIYATLQDPLSIKRMTLPARGKDCIHLQCFDAVQFLQMNELKQTWLCPICKKKLHFEKLEIDELFLNIVQTPGLSEHCKSIILLNDGSWTEKKPNCSNVTKLKSNVNQSNNDLDVISLLDSDDDDGPPAKCSKYSPPILKELLIKSESINITKIEDLTQTNNDKNVTGDLTQVGDNNSTKKDHVLDLSLKNGSSPSTSSDDLSLILVNSNLEKIPPIEDLSSCTKELIPHNITTENKNKDCIPNNSGNNEKNKLAEKHGHKLRSVLCTITLD